MAKRKCRETNKRGDRCGFSPQRESDVCWLHDPDHADEAREARRHGGLRRKRESTLAGAYEFDGILSEGGIGRYLDIAAYDALSLDFGVAKVRAMVAIAQVAEKVLHGADLQERVEALESVMGDKLKERRR